MGNEKNAYGKPVFDDAYTFPQDSQANADFADEFANVRVGTAAERQALPVAKQRNGMLWSETDTGTLWRTDGAGAWSRIGDSGWTTITTFGTGWSAVSGYAPQVRRQGTRVDIRGALAIASGGTFSNLVTVDPAFAPASGYEWVGVTHSNNSLAGELRIYSTGVIDLPYRAGSLPVAGILPLAGFWHID